MSQTLKSRAEVENFGHFVSFESRLHGALQGSLPNQYAICDRVRARGNARKHHHRVDGVIIIGLVMMQVEREGEDNVDVDERESIR